MQVEYVFGPNAGKQTHVRLDSITDLLIKAGVLQVVDSEPVVRNAPTAARFTVGRLPTTGVAIVKVTDGRTELFFDGKPEALVGHKFALAGGVVVPEEVQRQYAAMYNPNSLDAQLEGQAEALLQRGYRKER